VHLSKSYEDPQVLGAGGLIEPHWMQARPAWFPEEFYWVVGCSYRGMPTTTADVRNLIGCNMSFRREVCAEVGFSSLIGHMGGVPRGGSDPDFCIRVRQRWPEHTILYVPQAVVSHRVPKDRARWGYFCSRCRFEGRSKALLAQIVGTQDALSSEQAYTLRILPQGVLRALLDALFHRDLGGLPRAGAIVAGLSITTASYVAGVTAQQIAHFWPQPSRSRAVAALSIGVALPGRSEPRIEPKETVCEVDWCAAPAGAAGNCAVLATSRRHTNPRVRGWASAGRRWRRGNGPDDRSKWPTTGQRSV
jgi:hypothetical protein